MLLWNYLLLIIIMNYNTLNPSSSLFEVQTRALMCNLLVHREKITFAVLYLIFIYFIIHTLKPYNDFLE